MKICKQSNLKFRALLLPLIVVLLESRLIQVPAVTYNEQTDIRVGSVISLGNSSKQFGQLNKIYKQEIYQIVDGQEVSFDICQEVPPEVGFEVTAYKRISSPEQWFTPVVHEFQKIQFARMLLDIIHFESNIFYALSSGKIEMVQYDPKIQTIQSKRQFQINRFDVAAGFFVVADANVLFLNQESLFFIDLNSTENSLMPLPNYAKMKSFETASSLTSKYFAAAYGKQGVKIFSFDNLSKNVKEEALIDAKALGFKSFNIIDLTFNPRKNQLFMLDENAGIYALELVLQTNQFSWKLMPSVIRKRLCTLIFYDLNSDELYVSGRELFSFKISEWPIFSEKVLPKPDITIKEITSIKDMTAFVGRNIFEIIHLERKAAVYEDRLLDKFILQDNLFISANERKIIIGTFNVVPSTIVCQASSEKDQGSHKIQLKITASCNAAYLAETGFTTEMISAEDKCVYKIYQNVYVWIPAEFHREPFLIGILTVLGLILLVIIWFGYAELKLKKMKRSLATYETLEEEVGTQKEKNNGSMSNVEEVEVEMEKKEEVVGSSGEKGEVGSSGKKMEEGEEHNKDLYAIE